MLKELNMSALIYHSLERIGQQNKVERLRVKSADDYQWRQHRKKGKLIEYRTFLAYLTSFRNYNVFPGC